MKTTAAEAAKLLRKDLKAAFPSFKFRVLCKTYSMSSHIRIECPDRADKCKVQEIADKYRLGHFDGMTDSYIYSNRNDKLPQVKFIFVK